MKKLFPSSILFYFSIFIFFGCQTAEEVRREKMIEAMHGQLGQSQKLSAEFSNQLEELDKKINKLNGKIEEVDHRNSEDIRKNEEQTQNLLAQNQEKMILLEDQMKQIKEALEEQKNFIEKVTQSLSHLDPHLHQKKNQKEKQTSQTKVTKNSETSSYDEAMSLYKSGKYKTALPLLEALADDKKLSQNNRSKILHAAGYIKYTRKDWDGSLTLFSKIYSDLPKSIMAASSLLFIGKIFQQKGQKNDAKLSFEELISKFPKSRHVKEAKNSLEKL